MFVCKLKVILAERRIRQRDLAERIGITQASLSQIVNERTTPSLDVAYRIAEELKLSVHDIWVREIKA